MPNIEPGGKYVVDTNVPITANRASNIANVSVTEIFCVIASIDAIAQIRESCSLALDTGGEIFDEYRRYLSFSGQPGPGDAFMRWVHDSIGVFDLVEITRDGESYHQFPSHEGLTAFDLSDRKFVAVANAHPERPPILQATDSKWWGWRDALAETGISVHFMCPQLIEAAYHKKMGKPE